jgi:hypothetical protein
MVAEPKKPERKVPSNPFVTGPTKKVDASQSTAPVRRGVPETTRPVTRVDLMTEGMKAHRREIERRKRHAAVEKLHVEEQSADTRKSIWKWTTLVVVVLVVGFGYRELQDAYGNQWPMWDVWLLLAAALFGAIGWLLWYLSRPEL